VNPPPSRAPQCPPPLLQRVRAWPPDRRVVVIICTFVLVKEVNFGFTCRASSQATSASMPAHAPLAAQGVPASSVAASRGLASVVSALYMSSFVSSCLYHSAVA
jgi:hypothetical protein